MWESDSRMNDERDDVAENCKCNVLYRIKSMSLSRTFTNHEFTFIVERFHGIRRFSSITHAFAPFSFTIRYSRTSDSAQTATHTQ